MSLSIWDCDKMYSDSDDKPMDISLLYMDSRDKHDSQWVSSFDVKAAFASWPLLSVSLPVSQWTVAELQSRARSGGNETDFGIYFTGANDDNACYLYAFTDAGNDAARSIADTRLFHCQRRRLSWRPPSVGPMRLDPPNMNPLLGNAAFLRRLLTFL